jgi:hypothetical protein
MASMNGMTKKIVASSDVDDKQLDRECSVCFEKYDNKSHAKVVCEHGDCLYETCKTCVRTYLCATTSDANCMECNKVWSDKFLVENLNASFVRKEYKTHRKELLLQQQLSRLPETMAAVEIHKEVTKLEGQIRVLKKLAVEMNPVIDDLKGKSKTIKNDLFEFQYNPIDILSQNGIKLPNKSVHQTIIRNYIKNLTHLNHLKMSEDLKEKSEDLKENPAHLANITNGVKNETKRLEKEYKSLTGDEIPSLELYFEKERMYITQQEEINKQLTEAMAEKRTMLDNCNALYHDIQIVRNGGTPQGDVIKKEAKKFIMPCPKSECRGYLSSHYKCEMCEFHTCAKCFELIGESKSHPHECKQENIDSAEYIRKQSKPCPCCGTRISKIDGCDQMWCTQCHKAFSWNTGKLVTGVIHNPHFYQFQREHGGGIAPRNPGDVVCGGLCDYRELNQTLRVKKMPVAYLTISNTLFVIHRELSHLIHQVVTRAREKVRSNEDCLNERVKYIMNEITKEKLATLVMNKDTMRKKCVDILHIYELIVQVGIDMFRAITESTKMNTHFEQEALEHIEEFHKLIDYCNGQFKEISITYGMSVPLIDENLHVSTTKYNVNGNISSQIVQRDEKRKIQTEIEDKMRVFRENQTGIIRVINQELEKTRIQLLQLMDSKPTQEEKSIVRSSLVKYEKEMTQKRIELTKKHNDEYDTEVLKLKKEYETKSKSVLSDS